MLALVKLHAWLKTNTIFTQRNKWCNLFRTHINLLRCTCTIFRESSAHINMIMTGGEVIVWVCGSCHQSLYTTIEIKWWRYNWKKYKEAKNGIMWSKTMSRDGSVLPVTHRSILSAHCITNGRHLSLFLLVLFRILVTVFFPYCVTYIAYGTRVCSLLHQPSMNICISSS